ncbi:DUF2244 domain-containing protein [Oxalobacteraceae bacterium CAVE-383]|nr:DUF2244 domain-containing protein [Oxalobacteraceae bacterium CAVE-383]
MSASAASATKPQQWVLKRNCSITPRQLGGIYAALCCASLGVALLCTLQGAWFVLVFAVLELCAVGAAFLVYARHATDADYLALAPGVLEVEVVQGAIVKKFKFDPRRTRVDMVDGRQGLVVLEDSGIRVEVGRFLTQWKRRQLAQQLRLALPDGSDAMG